MPLPLPVLDDRGFEELIEGMRERLPRIAPGWTDHNASDPGITLLELFAYQADILSYRFDRIPPRLYRAFLRLLGCEPRRERAALTPLVFGCAPGAARTLAPGIQAGDARAQQRFQTRTAFHVSDATLAVVLTETGGRRLDRSAANDSLAGFAPLGASPAPGDALYLGFDRIPAPAGARLRLWLFGADLESDVGAWLALRQEWRRDHHRRRRCVSRVAWHQHYGVRLAWEFFDGQHWRELGGLADRTRSLSLSGPVRWRMSAAHAPGGVSGHDTKYFIRCRLLEGAYDCAPRIRGLRLNTVLAHHAADVAGAVTPARCTGGAHARFRLPRAPVVPGSVQLTLTTAEGVVENWTERPDFDRSGAHARHFVLDARTGDLLFGDGRSGAVPESGSTLAARWRIGGGAAGNVPAGSVAMVHGLTAVAVSQPVPACRGEDAETLEASKARAYRTLRTERCAATLADLVRATLDAPALPVARAFAVSEAHPDLGCLEVAGCVSVVIVPSCVDLRRDPTPELCAAVAQYLESRRPLALELHVVGPRYARVNATVMLALEPGARAPEVRARAGAALAKFLHPLEGGPDGGGWKVGRAVYRSEVLAVLGRVAGVHHVARLELAADDGGAAACSDIPLCANGLVVSGVHEIHFLDGAGR
jgi:predicted phage baseplate assembly protein